MAKWTMPPCMVTRLPSAVGLGEDGAVGPDAALDQVVAALAALGLAHHAGQHQVAAQA